jgi:hypothetical protein
MPLLPSLTGHVLREAKRRGTPLAVSSEDGTAIYMLMIVHCTKDSAAATFTARIPGISAYGEGATQEEASLALCEALRGYQEAFPER